jgi:iron only hydrogenase large subunit-like protein
MDAGLTFTAGVHKILRAEEIRVVSGAKNVETVLQEFKTNSKIRFVDVLFCEGGCINGPGINSALTIEQRKTKIFNYFRQGQSLEEM